MLAVATGVFFVSLDQCLHSHVQGAGGKYGGGGVNEDRNYQEDLARC